MQIQVSDGAETPAAPYLTSCCTTCNRLHSRSVTPPEGILTPVISLIWSAVILYHWLLCQPYVLCFHKLNKSSRSSSLTQGFIAQALGTIMKQCHTYLSIMSASPFSKVTLIIFTWQTPPLSDITLRVGSPSKSYLTIGKMDEIHIFKPLSFNQTEVDRWLFNDPP